MLGLLKGHTIWANHSNSLSTDAFGGTFGPNFGVWARNPAWLIHQEGQSPISNAIKRRTKEIDSFNPKC
jgi:hypothetical protein